MHPFTRQTSAKSAKRQLSKFPMRTKVLLSSPITLSNERFEVEDVIQTHLGGQQVFDFMIKHFWLLFYPKI
jgi:hypothetical protein